MYTSLNYGKIVYIPKQFSAKHITFCILSQNDIALVYLFL